MPQADPSSLSEASSNERELEDLATKRPGQRTAAHGRSVSPQRPPLPAFPTSMWEDEQAADTSSMDRTVPVSPGSSGGVSPARRASQRPADSASVDRSAPVSPGPRGSSTALLANSAAG